MNDTKKTVLVVEDDELNAKLFHDLLEAHGYNILQTKDGMDALRLAREHKPDFILMDIQLPEVSGLEVTKWIKEDDELKSIPVIAVTAFAMKGDEEKAREAGCDAYISKPISVTNFLEFFTGKNEKDDDETDDDDSPNTDTTKSESTAEILKFPTRDNEEDT